MEMETALHITSNNATDEELTNAFKDDAGRGDFIILSQSTQVYIQASGEGNNPYVMEYREGDGDHHFQCTRDVSKDNVQSAFLKYLKGDPSWKTDFQWRHLDNKPNKPWWNFW
jgi:hypothetical protein